MSDESHDEAKATPTPEVPYIDEKTIRLFFEFLGSTLQCNCYMDESSLEPIKGYGVRYEDVDHTLSQLREFEERGTFATLHTVLNLTDLKGRKKSNIVATRVFAVDLDTVRTREKIKEIVKELKVSMVVESSPARYHLYWKVQRGITTHLDPWKITQAGLAGYLGGDLGLADVNKTLRVPGVRRVTKAGELFLPRILFLKETEPFTPEELRQFMEWGEKALAMKTQEYRKRIKLGNALRKATSGEVFQRQAKELGKVGGRNDTLYQVTKDACLEGNGEASEDFAFNFAMSVNEAFEEPLSVEEVKKTSDSAYRHAEELKEKRKERFKEMGAIEEGQEDSVISPPSGSAPKPPGQSARKLEIYSGRYLINKVWEEYSKEIVRLDGVVYAFNRSTFTWENQKTSPAVVSDQAEAIVNKAVKEPKFIEIFGTTREGAPSERNLAGARRKFLSSGFVSGIKGGVLELNSIPSMRHSDFNCDPELILCANGVLNLSTGELRAPTPEDKIFAFNEVSWDESASTEWWEGFVSEVFADNESPAEMVSFIQTLFGYSLSASIDEQKIFCHFGSGSNGKSKILDSLGIILGSYIKRLNCQTLSKSKNSVIKEFERLGASIVGKRAVLIDDLDTSTQWNEGFVKSLTSSRIPSRKLYEEEMDIVNTAKFHIGCNELPTVEGENYGLLRRLCIIRYNRTFKDSGTMERAIQKKLKEEAPGILKWAFIGYQRYIKELKGTLVYPQEVLAQREEYKEKEFPIESACRELFDCPVTDAENPEGSWYPNEVLVTQVNNFLKNQGVGKTITADKLGNVLANTLGYKRGRKWVEKVLKRGFFVSLKIPLIRLTGIL